MYLWSANRAQQPAYVILPALLATLALLAVVYLLAALLLRRGADGLSRAALSTTAISLMALSYGHFMTLTRQWGWGLQHRFMLPAAGVVMLALLILIQRFRFDSAPLTKILNVISAGLLLLPLLQAGSYYLLTAQRKVSLPVESAPVQLVSASASSKAGPQRSKQRDVYFILLDNYGRQDHLLTHERYDNSALVAALKARGFVLPDCAQGNYPGTAPVMTSILNMTYLDALPVAEAEYLDKNKYAVLAPYLRDNLVMQQFRAYGYRLVTFRGFMDMIDIQNVDDYVNYEKDAGFQTRLETVNFDDLYFQTTILHPINAQLKIYPDWLAAHGPRFLFSFLPDQKLLPERFYKVYKQNVYAFDALQQLPQTVQSPKFVYAHLYATHWPYMLRPDGTLRLPFTESTSTAGYLDGVRYANNRLLPAIDALLAQPGPKPIIIIQGDHANGWEGDVEWSGNDRLQILSAYYLPDGGDQLLTPDISPVNNFRLIFKYYFGEAIDLLPNVNHALDPQSKRLTTAPGTCLSDTIR